jgi:transposase
VRRATRLGAWIDKASTAGFRSVARYAKTLRRDIRAAELAITTPWSNGPIEGQVNRFKAIKRQMYGRAGFELLRARVLPLEPLPAC